MIWLIGQMLGCLLVAAGIGGVVGWLLRNLSAAPITQHLLDTATELRVKEQALDTALYELKVNASAVHALESKLASTECLGRAIEQDLDTRNERIRMLQEELAAMAKQLSAWETDHAALLQRLSDGNAVTADYAREAREADAARAVAQQDLERKEQEVLDLEHRVTELEGRLAETERLRAQFAELEPAQGRVHWLEVQLSEKDARHRAAVHQLEKRLADRDRRIGELEKYEPVLQERDRYIGLLQKQIEDLNSAQKEIAGQVKMMGEKEEEISRLRKRLGEVRAALRVRTDGGNVVARPTGPANQLSLQIGQFKSSNGPQKDDLKKIHGIGPVIERALNKMGTYTYVQIAKWTPADIARVSQKLETNPDRIKRDNWIAGAKKQHREKYGEKL
jgi:predicted flap endonuclease-1-like 5' DNA nuclease